MTDSELRLIAAAASSGLRRMPNTEYVMAEVFCEKFALCQAVSLMIVDLTMGPGFARARS
jgi:hypothetical protein